VSSRLKKFDKGEGFRREVGLRGAWTSGDEGEGVGVKKKKGGKNGVLR